MLSSPTTLGLRVGRQPSFRLPLQGLGSLPSPGLLTGAKEGLLRRGARGDLLCGPAQGGRQLLQMPQADMIHPYLASTMDPALQVVHDGVVMCFVSLAVFWLVVRIVFFVFYSLDNIDI